ncbi:MAG TPA: AAA family ATPase [Ardenticatenaceae bacterium]|nr:AAA family ATPase [Ardenticatenaceae bacterium]
MEAVIFVGTQGAGKSSFFKERFFHTHVHVSLDVLKTRHREERILEVCLETQQPFVIDNTNPTRADRARYISAARANDFRVVGYYFQSRLQECLARNAQRQGQSRVPDVALLATHKKLQLPALVEGFDVLYYVRIDLAGQFVVEEWTDEV